VTHERRTPPRSLALVAGLGVSLLGAVPQVAAAPPEPIAPSPPTESVEPAPTEAQPEPEPATENSELVLTRVLPANAQVTARLHAELGVSGLEGATIEIADDLPSLGIDLLDRAAAANASAAIEIVFGRNRVDIWVADANTGKTLNRRFDLILDPGLAEPRTLAIAAVELLRTSRLELAEVAIEPDEPESPPQATENERPPQERAAALPPPRGSLSLAPIVGGSPGGLGLTTHIEVAGRWAPRKRFALRTSLWIPTLGNRVVDGLEAARVLTLQLFIEPQLRLPGGAPWFHPELGLGLGGALTVIQGQPSPNSIPQRPVLPGFSTHAHLGLGFELSPRFWFRIDGYAGIVQPQPRVVFRDDENVDHVVATWGLPFGSGSIGFEVWF
jgi:hypothetical protein